MVSLTSFDLFQVAMTAIVGMILAIIPYLTQKSIVFGVRTPPEFKDSEIILRAKKTYVFSVLLITLILVAVQVSVVPSSDILLISIFPLFVILLAFFVYLPEHYMIEKTKRSEDWMGKTNQSVSATFVSGKSGSFPWVYAIPGIVVLAAFFIIGIMDYNNIPSVFATHFGANGQPNAYSVKSIGTVFLMGFIGIGSTLSLILLAYFISRSAFRVDSSSSSALGRSVVFRSRMTKLLLLIPAFISLTLIIGGFEEWGLIGHGPNTLLYILAPVFVMVALTVGISVTTGQAGSNLRMTSGSNTSYNLSGQKDMSHLASTKDDDSYWKAGVVYVNRKDSRWLVPKRFGVGYTLNFAHPGSIILIAALISFPIILVVMIRLMH